MKVKVINKNLDDLQDKVFRPVGSTFDVSKERADFLLKNKAVEIVEEVKEETKIDITENEFEVRSQEVKEIINKKTNEAEEIIKPKTQKKKKTSKK